MSAETLKTVAPTTPLLCYVVGKVTKAQFREGKYYTTIICAAKDEYSQPAVVEIRSETRIAEQEEIFKGYAALGGFLGREFEVKDRQTGEVRKARSVILTLDAVKV